MRAIAVISLAVLCLTSCTSQYLVRKTDLDHAAKLVAVCPYTGQLISRCAQWPEMKRNEVFIPAKKARQDDQKPAESEYLRLSKTTNLARNQSESGDWVVVNAKNSARKPLIYTGSALLAAGLGVFLGFAIPDLLSEDDKNKGYGMIVGGALFGVVGSFGLTSLIWGLCTDSTISDAPAPTDWPSLSRSQE